MTVKYYSGIGGRDTPASVQAVMTNIAEQMAYEGYTLRSGGANGADEAFRQGCDNAFGRGSIFLPWKGYNGHYDRQILDITYHSKLTEEAFDLASQHHPAWSKCSHTVKKFHARNAQIILGENIDAPSEFVVCYTRNGKDAGGTGLGIRIAQSFDIPVYNLYYESHYKELLEIIGDM